MSAIECSIYIYIYTLCTALPNSKSSYVQVLPYDTFYVSHTGDNTGEPSSLFLTGPSFPALVTTRIVRFFK